jgi:hypothetical protein
MMITLALILLGLLAVYTAIDEFRSDYGPHEL